MTDFIIVPCFNEALRLKAAPFYETTLEHPTLHWLFVDDGSRDATFNILEQWQKTHPERFHILRLTYNQGKAEAVRQGLERALQLGANRLGYLDADLATPISEYLRLLRTQSETQKPFVMGSRLLLQGHQIERTALRLILGKVFAWVASGVLKQRFADTQCGAKVLLYHPKLDLVLQKPFVSKWLFDVELILRCKSILDYKNHDFYEEPLRAWREVGGSKVKWHSFITAVMDLYRIFRSTSFKP